MRQQRYEEALKRILELAKRQLLDRQLNGRVSASTRDPVAQIEKIAEEALTRDHK